MTSHTYSDSTGTYDVLALIDRLAKRRIHTLPLASLGVNKSRKSGYSKKRFDRANTSFPGIVYGLKLIDGRHRVLKLISQGAEHGQFYNATSADMKAVKLK